MPEFFLTLRLPVPGDTEADKLAAAIADLCAAEFGTSDPRLAPADGDRKPLEALADVSCQHTRHYAMCCRCAADAVRPGVERLLAELAEAKAELAKREADVELGDAKIAELNRIMLRLQKRLAHAQALTEETSDAQ